MRDYLLRLKSNGSVEEVDELANHNKDILKELQKTIGKL